MVRLQRFLAAAGVASRRASERLIVEGRVTVNGSAVTTLGTQVDPERDEVRLDGRLIQPPTRYTYLLLNKPAGYLSTRRDPGGRASVYELLPAATRHLLRSVGRLDRDTEGLLLFTDDGELLFRLTHPSFEVPKTYDVVVDGAVTGEALAALERGIVLDDGTTAPARAEVVSRKASETRLLLTIHEGRKREVRRMMQAVGFPVRRLVRTRMGTLALGSLPVGAIRPLSEQEIASLRHLVGLEGPGGRGRP